MPFLLSSALIGLISQPDRYDLGTDGAGNV
jgi:hypothetical protein